MSKVKTLKCTSAAHVNGEIIKAGVVAEYEQPLASRLLASNRFVAVEDDLTEVEPSPPSTVAELKEALDDLEVEYDSDAKKADLENLYAEATSS